MKIIRGYLQDQVFVEGKEDLAQGEPRNFFPLFITLFVLLWVAVFTLN